MAVSINISENNQVAIQQSATPSVSLVNVQSNSVSVKKAYVNSISINNVKPASVILTNPQSGNQAISTWGAITGTITNQTDLVNYITSRLSSDTINDAADVLQVLENAGLTFEESSIDAKIPFSIYGKDENGDPIVIPNTTTPLGYTLPKPNTELLSNTPYLMVTKSDGTNVNLTWLDLGFVFSGEDTLFDGGQFE